MRALLLFFFFALALPLQAQRQDFVNINLSISEDIAMQYQGEDLYNLPKLAHQLTSSFTTDIERFRSIYFWVCHNITSEYHLTLKNERKLKKFKDNPIALKRWEKQFKKEVFNRLRLKKETLCSGYAYLIKELSNLAGLECEIINGYSQEDINISKSAEIANHAWNAVKLNGKWYLCDATWSSGYTDMSTFKFKFDYDDSYFLMEPYKFGNSHKPIDAKWTLLTPSTGFEIPTGPKKNTSLIH